MTEYATSSIQQIVCQRRYIQTKFSTKSTPGNLSVHQPLLTKVSFIERRKRLAYCRGSTTEMVLPSTTVRFMACSIRFLKLYSYNKSIHVSVVGGWEAFVQKATIESILPPNGRSYILWGLGQAQSKELLASASHWGQEQCKRCSWQSLQAKPTPNSCSINVNSSQASNEKLPASTALQ